MLRSCRHDRKKTASKGTRRLRDDYPVRSSKRSRASLRREKRQAARKKKGELTGLLKQLGSVPPRAASCPREKVNLLKQEVERAFDARLAELRAEKRQADAHARPST